MSQYSCRIMSINVDFPQPDGAERTRNKGLVFILGYYIKTECVRKSPELDFSICVDTHPRFSTQRPAFAGGLRGCLKFSLRAIQQLSAHQDFDPYCPTVLA